MLSLQQLGQRLRDAVRYLDRHTGSQYTSQVRSERSKDSQASLLRDRELPRLLRDRKGLASQGNGDVSVLAARHHEPASDLSRPERDVGERTRCFFLPAQPQLCYRSEASCCIESERRPVKVFILPSLKGCSRARERAAQRSVCVFTSPVHRCASLSCF